MNSSKWHIKYDYHVRYMIFFISCFFYPISLLYLLMTKKPLKRHFQFLIYFILTVTIIYIDPRKQAVGKEGVFAFVIVISCTISFLMYVFSKRSELPDLRNDTVSKYQYSKKKLIFIFSIEAVIIEGFTFLILTGIWPAKGYEIIWSSPNWQAYVRFLLAILLVIMSIKLIWNENRSKILSQRIKGSS